MSIEKQHTYENHEHHSGHHSSHHHHSSRRHSSHRRSSSADMRFSMKLKRFLFTSGSHRSGISSAQRLSKISRSTAQTRHDTYMLISRRVIFSIIFIGIIVYLSYTSITADINDKTLKNASLTASETTQLKTQVTQLKNQVEILESELARYKHLYGELNDIPTSSDAAE